MASRWRLSLMVSTALAGLALQACVAVPVRESRPAHYAQPAYGYGGSGYSDVNVDEARRVCLREARDFRGYRGVRAQAVEVTGRERARVELRVRDRGTYGGTARLSCAYDGRTGRAFVP